MIETSEGSNITDTVKDRKQKAQMFADTEETTDGCTGRLLATALALALLGIMLMLYTNITYSVTYSILMQKRVHILGF